MDRTVTWGILGTGDIARQMAEDLRLVPHAVLRAVASRTQRRADAFGDTHNIPVRHGSYEALARDPDVDVVYVATPHPWHCEHTLLCIEHGKAVLCEKPIGLNADEAERMFSAARRANTFLMEAMWTAFFPAIKDARQALAADRIGTPRLLTANFSYKAAYDPSSRLFDLALGGGGLLDIGIYTVALADMVFEREPEVIQSAWTGAPTGADESGALILDYGSEQRAVLTYSLGYDAPQEALVAGNEGVIRIPDQFSQPDRWILDRGGDAETYTFDRQGYGYHLEAAEVTTCIRSGDVTSDVVPPAATLRIMRTLDRIRAAWGLRYPME